MVGHASVARRSPLSQLASMAEAESKRNKPGAVVVGGYGRAPYVVHS
jgi:hypothetical protein